MENKLNLEEIENVLAKADQLYTEREILEALDEMAGNISLRLQQQYPPRFDRIKRLKSD